MQRYFINEENVLLDANKIIIKGKDVHHIKNVMRMKIGDEIICSTEHNSYLVKITSINDFVETSIIDKLNKSNELMVEVTIAHGLTTREKREEVIQKITQLGALKYIPVLTEKSVVKISDNIEKQTERLNKIAKEASEQSQREKILKVSLPISINELIKLKDEYDVSFIASTKLDAKINNLNKNLKNKKKILIVIGPEAGFSEKEENKLMENGFIPISLGKRILRCEVAPLYIMSVISYLDEYGEDNEI